MTEMTDEELAARLKRIAPVVIPRGPLLEEAADRLYALSAKCELLGASLAKAEREAEAAKPAIDTNVEAVRAALLDRSKVGIIKYGTTTSGAGEGQAYWLRHLQEELMDAAVYVEAVLSARDASGLARRVAEIAQSRIGAQRPCEDEPEERDYWDMCQRVIDGEQPAASAEPVAWLTHSRNGMVRSLLPTRTPDESLMRGDVQQPLYAAPQPDRVAELTAELETERQRLAACGVAALGYFDGCADEYKSASLGDVLRLRAEVERLRGLIAAAPDLLEALDTLCNRIELERVGAPPIDWPSYKAARAAIAKATGKEAAHA